MKEVLIQSAFVPKEHQTYAHFVEARFKVLVWHRRAGKTMFAVNELVEAAVACMKQFGRFGYVAPLLMQARAAAWDYLKLFTSHIPGVQVHETNMEVTLPGNGARIRLYGADNPDAMRGGYFDGLVMDEVADMRPNLWGEVIRPALMDRQGWCIFIGTPRGLNLFSEKYYESLRTPGWWGDVKRWSDTGMIPEAEVEAARREMGPAQWAQEMECDFSASSPNVLIESEVVREAAARDAKPPEYQWAAPVLGVDVARGGNDASVIIRRQGRVAFRPKLYRKVDTMTLASLVAEEAVRVKAQRIFVDGTGIGGGVVDRLRSLGLAPFEVGFGNKSPDPGCKNMRAFIWKRMGEWMKEGCIPDDVGLIAELSAVTKSYDAQSRLTLEAKEDMEARGLPSPDRADALACTFAMPDVPRELVVGWSTTLDRCETEWNPRAVVGV